MASYTINLVDNLDGSFTLSHVGRAPVAFGSGTAIGPVASGGQAVGETTGWTYGSNGTQGGFVGNPGEVLFKAVVIVQNDRATNG